MSPVDGHFFDRGSVARFRWPVIGVALWLATWAGLNAPISPFVADGRPFVEVLRWFLPVFVATWSAVAFYARRRAPLSAFPFTSPVGMLFAYGLVGLLATWAWSPDPLIGSYWAIAFLAVPMALAAVCGLFGDAASTRLMMWLQWAIAFAFSGLYLGRLFIDHDLAGLIARGEIHRVFGSRNELIEGPLKATANGIARFASIVAILCASRLVMVGRRRRFVWLAALLPSVLLLVYTISRTAIVGLALAVAVLVLLHRGRRAAVSVVSAGILVVLAMGFFGGLFDYFARGQAADAFLTFTGRSELWAQGVELWLSSPLFGWGFHADRLILDGHMHNAALHALVQAGIVGLAFFLAAWVWSVRSLIRSGLFTRFQQLETTQRIEMIDAAALLTFFGLRSVFESSGAFFGVDLLFIAVVFHHVRAIERSPHAAPTHHPGVASDSAATILVCAYACRPPGSPDFEGGEDLLGWKLALQAARFSSVVVLTRPENQRSVEAELKTTPVRGLRFVYLDLPRPLHVMKRVQGGLQFYAYLWQWKALGVARRLHSQAPFALVHHLTYANDWMASPLGAFLPIPYVRGPGGGAHRVPRAFFGGRGGRFAFVQTLRSIFQRLFRLDPAFRLGHERASALLLCTPESIEALPERWKGKATLFPVNGIDASTINPPGSRGRNGLTVFTAGKLLTIKGFDLALRAFARASLPSGSRLRIAGDGPERGTLERLAADLGVRERVEFLGWLPHARVIDGMNESDLFLFPSLRDGGGGVVVEALATGLPVVCLELAGPGLHVTDECGIKVRPDNPEAAVEGLARALERLSVDTKLRAELSDGARRRAERDYDWTILGNRLHTFYKTAIGTKSISATMADGKLRGAAAAHPQVGAGEA